MSRHAGGQADTALRVVIVGLGPIGAACARAVRRERGLDLVGLCDLDPSKQGKTARELSGGELKPDEDAGPAVTDDLDAAIGTGADVAVLTTTSSFSGAAPLLKKLLDRGLAVVSSCEEMLWPTYRHAELAKEMDAAAKQAGRALLGTGVNPGFVMDLLPVVLATMVRRVNTVRCVRQVDAALRREPLQRKVGATMSVEQFQSLAKEGKLGHKGLAESLALLAAGLGRTVEPGSVHETLDPVVADEPMNSALGMINPGQVRGMHNVATWQGGGLEITLDLTMAVGEENPKDKVWLGGPVQLCLKIPGGVPGDSATVAALLNQIRNVHHAAPGLHTLLDLPPAGCLNCDRG